MDWDHFGALRYNGTPRKLYAFSLVECHSRKMYLEFTHSQSFETFARCHIHAFQAMTGCAREAWFDNLATAVAEHEGNLVRFNPLSRLCSGIRVYPTDVRRSGGRERAGELVGREHGQPAQTSRNRPSSRPTIPSRVLTAPSAAGADYIANILRQQQTRREIQPPLRLKDPELNGLATDPLALFDYDAFILRARKDSHDIPDVPSNETGSTQLDDYEPSTRTDRS